MKKMDCVRWAFHYGSWFPTQSEWIRATQCVQPEEKTRIARFVYKRDAKAAICGRLLLRKCVQEMLQIPFEDIEISRTEKGKPVLTNQLPESLANFSMNISHQGGYAVLAADKHRLIGTDVMKVEWARGEKTVQSFFQTMSRQFTTMEWSFIRQPSSDWEQLRRFYRLWCLKESYVKALGVGIGFELQKINFLIRTSELNTEFVVRDTQVMVNGILETDWIFEETMLDDCHCVAVAIRTRNKEQTDNLEIDKTSKFKHLTLHDLVWTVEPIFEPDLENWKLFDSKNENQFVQHNS
ncbi:L-aminoadipate-semialdehyde dehydrogenase-phosphopantetheinyl transferase-like isoform X2 [Tubulanus polymorphus]